MRIRIETFFFLLIGLLAFARAGQSQEPITWQTIISSNNEFAITIPENFLSYKNERWPVTEIVGGSGGAGFEIALRNTMSGYETVKQMAAGPVIKGKRSAFTIGESQMVVSVFEGQKSYRAIVYIATKKALYSLSISAPAADNSVLRAVLASVRLNDRPIFQDAKVSSPIATSSINVKELQNSDLVRTALKRKQKDRITSEEAPKDFEPPDSEIVYSRPALIVHQPVAVYTSDARMNNVQGAVRLRIQLKANGNLGKIVVVKGLPYGLTRQAIDAASQIKFIPAEIDGRPADVEVTREYTFSIY